MEKRRQLKQEKRKEKMGGSAWVDKKCEVWGKEEETGSFQGKNLEF